MDGAVHTARADRGLIDADLGGGLTRQRVARPTEGRRGGFRMLIGYKVGHRAVFLFGFSKNELDDLSDQSCQSCANLGLFGWELEIRRSVKAWKTAQS